MVNPKRPTLKTRIPALLLLVVCLLSAVWTGWNLKQAIDIERELRHEMADLSLAASTAANHPAASTVTTGESSLTTALNEVRGDGHKLEAWLALQTVGILAGVLLLRRRPV